MSKQKAQEYPAPFAVGANGNQFDLKNLGEHTEVKIAELRVWPVDAEVRFVARILPPGRDGQIETPYAKPNAHPNIMVPTTAFLADFPNREVRFIYQIKTANGEVNDSEPLDVRIIPR